MDNNNKIKEIINGNNIVDIIKNFLQVQKRGNNFLALCPFHDDKHPSLSISEDKQIFKCFSCGEFGNVLSFLMKFKKWDFKIALTYLGNQINYDLNWLNLKKESQKEDKIKFLSELNQKVNNYYHNNLFVEKNQAILNYLLNERKIPLEIIKKYQIGYASSNDNIIAFLEEDGYKLSDLVKYSIAKITNSKLSSYFSNRIIINLKNQDHKIIGFSGRTIQKNNNLNYVEVKYLNSRTNFLYQKNNFLFNLNYSYENIKSMKFLFVVEGYFDCLSLIKVNIFNVVALMGLSISKQQIEILKKVTKKVILWFDSDVAGILATLKIAQILINNKFKVQILTNKSKLNDPEDFINKNITKVKFIFNCLKNSFSLESFKLQNYQVLKQNSNLIEQNKKTSQFKKNIEINNKNKIKNNNATKENLNYLFLNLIMQLILSASAYNFLKSPQKLLLIYNQIKNNASEKILFKKILSYYTQNKNLTKIDFKNLWNYFYQLNENNVLKQLNWIRLQLKINKNFERKQIIYIFKKYQKKELSTKTKKIINNSNDELDFNSKVKMLNKLK